MMANVLIVEDDLEFAEKCARILISHGYIISHCDTAENGKRILLEKNIDAALIDLMLPPTYTTEGIEFLHFLIRKRPQVCPLMMTTRSDEMTELVAKAMRQGAQYFFDKKSATFFDNVLFNLKEWIMESADQIFVSHGHNELLKFALKDFLQNRLSKKPLVLSELPSRGMTIVEKLEHAARRCSFAVILMTKDDAQKGGDLLRARQNVIHEIGFFQGKYGRKKVVLLAERGVELFSNISGIVRIEFEADQFEAVFEPLRIEIEAENSV